MLIPCWPHFAPIFSSQVPVEVPEVHAVELLTELPKPQYEKVPKEIPLCHGRWEHAGENGWQKMGKMNHIKKTLFTHIFFAP